MSRKIQALVILALLNFTSVGCQTAEKLAWWKSSENAQTEAEVLARSAPALPSEMARQSEAMAANGVNITPSTASGGMAAPYVPPTAAPPASSMANVAAPYVAPTAAPPASTMANVAAPYSSYPTTGANGYSPKTTIETPGAAQPSSSNLGSVAMPYNPDAVPAPPTAAPQPSVVASSVDRYAGTTGMTTPVASTPVTSSASATPATMPSYAGSNDRYGSSVSSAAPTAQVQQTGNAPAASAAPSYEITPTSGDDRYGSYESHPVTPYVAEASPVTPTASASPYRPGGTSDYPGQSSVEVATRPTAGSTTESTPYDTSGQPAYPQTPQYR